MLERNIFENISPLDHRYSPGGEDFDLYPEFLSEKARIKYLAKVEAALVRVLSRRGLCTEEVADEVEKAAGEIIAEEVYEKEKVTKHDIRALVNCIQERVSREARPFVHFTATSYDIVDTANSLRYKEVTREFVVPCLLKLEQELMELALREKDTVQIGRTHGQHADPVTFGFMVAGYVSRMGNRIESIEKTSGQLKGKLSGAVGAYNASSLFFADPEEFEREFLTELGLEAAAHSTQIVEPEYLTDYIHSLVSCLGVLANFSDDMRHLQRTEIDEVSEYFTADQVGSSTMPHKRNPINYENVKSMWKEFMPRMITVYQDQISEHQRDLTNSASGRFVPEIIAGLLSVVNRLSKVCSRIRVNHANLEKNFNQSKEMIVAEPLYILLASYGHPDAHEKVRQLTLIAEKEGRVLRELINEDQELKPYLEQFNEKQRELLHNPEEYTGIAARKTEDIVSYWKKKLNLN